MNTMLRQTRRLAAIVVVCAAGAATVLAQPVDWSTKTLQSERSRAYDALHYRVALTLKLDERTFAGEATVTLTALSDGLETVVLDAEEFTVTKVVTEWGEPLEFSQTEKELSIRMKRPLKRGETRTFSCTCHGKDPKQGLKFVTETADNPAIVCSEWLNESLATYSDYLYFRHDRGDDEGAVNLQAKLNAYLREAKTRYVRPIVSDRYDQPGDMFDSHSYPKGARVLHMLRDHLGDAAFFDTLKHFLHRYAFDAVDTGDFVRCERHQEGRARFAPSGSDCGACGARRPEGRKPPDVFQGAVCEGPERRSQGRVAAGDRQACRSRRCPVPRTGSGGPVVPSHDCHRREAGD